MWKHRLPLLSTHSFFRTAETVQILETLPASVYTEVPEVVLALSVKQDKDIISEGKAYLTRDVFLLMHVFT